LLNLSVSSLNHCPHLSITTLIYRSPSSINHPLSFLIIKLPKNTTSSKTSVFDSTIAAAAVTDTMHVTFFVFSCPENAHIRMKMIMSSSKVSLPSSSVVVVEVVVVCLFVAVVGGGGGATYIPTLPTYHLIASLCIALLCIYI